jgi:hypothetical protein
VVPDGGAGSTACWAAHKDLPDMGVGMMPVLLLCSVVMRPPVVQWFLQLVHAANSAMQCSAASSPPSLCMDQEEDGIEGAGNASSDSGERAAKRQRRRRPGAAPSLQVRLLHNWYSRGASKAVCVGCWVTLCSSGAIRLGLSDDIKQLC